MHAGSLAWLTVIWNGPESLIMLLIAPEEGLLGGITSWYPAGEHSSGYMHHRSISELVSSNPQKVKLGCSGCVRPKRDHHWCSTVAVYSCCQSSFTALLFIVHKKSLQSILVTNGKTGRWCRRGFHSAALTWVTQRRQVIKVWTPQVNYTAWFVVLEQKSLCS